jgi:GNAT superfamily N-acetyltransferase
MIRSAQPDDTPAIFQLILALAEYEQLSHQVTGSVAALNEHLFGDRPYIEAVLAVCDGQPVGFALFFTNYSTFQTQPGLYLEDLFVLPDYRAQGVGKALLSHLARLAVERQYGRLAWSVLDWNTPAIGFYQRIGVNLPDSIRICRIAGDALHPLAMQPYTALRPASPQDIPALFALARANAEFDQSLHAFVGNPEALAAHLFGDRPFAEAVVAEQAEQIVGFAIFFFNYSTFLTKPGLYIEDLFVLPEFRRQGIGQALLAYLAQETVRRNCGRLEWLVRIWNEPAIAFYQKMGATVLPDWRICLLDQTAIGQLAN